MATNEVPRGPISDRVAENVRRLRDAKRWSLTDLSEEMRRVGRPMLSSGLHRLETGKRRVDADDLVALALAFGVSPVTMMMPFTARGDVRLTDTMTADALAAWDWMRGLRPIDLPADEEEATYVAARFRTTAVPMGARIGELRPGTPEYEERMQRNAAAREKAADQWRRAGEAWRGEHPEAT